MHRTAICQHHGQARPWSLRQPSHLCRSSVESNETGHRGAGHEHTNVPAPSDELPTRLASIVRVHRRAARVQDACMWRSWQWRVGRG
ncbi:hypothetical protein DYB32_002354 [Aphanomyces invadans]|uniref:Uncharacterized protein n=1 Tax=Aphanomyces invadans TaxID=157072 RepID=A0A3R7D476_9STRA|nr:hypothetical protein DYB32_002354 [Aphanomyces invadans]